MRLSVRAAPIVLLMLAGAVPLVLVAGGETLPGPIPAEVLRVVDGDTLEVEAHIWLGQGVQVSVRLRGVDAPEFKGRCEAERVAALKARARLSELTSGGDVRLADIGYDKFGGRVLARVIDATGRDLGQQLIADGVARAYDGRARRTWCDA
jgi:endonuclease YncB( thermonuclease family)